MTNALAIWILSLMHLLQPAAQTPWASGFGETAAAIAVAANAEPVYAGPRAVERTAALLVSLTWFEARFKHDAVDEGGNGLCLGQIDISNLRTLGMTRERILSDRATCLHASLVMIRESFRICRDRPSGDALGWYARGRVGCDHALEKSRARMRLAERLLREHPFVLPNAA